MGYRNRPTLRFPATAGAITAHQSGVVSVTIDDVTQQGDVVEVTITAEGPQTNTPFELDVTIDVQGLGTIGSESASYAIERNNQTITRTLDIEIGGPSEEEELAATIEAVATDPNGDTRSDSTSETLTNPTFAAEVSIEDCSVRTSAGDLLVDLDTSTNTGELVERDVEVRVDGSRVLTESRNWPDGSTTTLSVPISELPTGEDMDVEVGIGGNFSNCGTVTVEDDDESGSGDGGDLELVCGGTDSEVQAGEETSAEYTATYTGDVFANVDFALEVRGERVDSTSYGFGPDDREFNNVVTFEVDEPGEYDVVAVAQNPNAYGAEEPLMSDCGTIKVVPAFEEGDVTASCPNLPDEVTVGEEFRLEWTIENGNDAPANAEFELRVGGDVVDSGTEDVDADGTTYLTSGVVIEEIEGSSEDVPVEVDVVSAEPR